MIVDRQTSDMASLWHHYHGHGALGHNKIPARTYILTPSTPSTPYPTHSTYISYVLIFSYPANHIPQTVHVFRTYVLTPSATAISMACTYILIPYTLYSHTLHTIFHTLHTIFSHPTHYIPRTCARQIGRDFFGVWVGQQPPVFWSVRVCVRERVCVHA